MQRRHHQALLLYLNVATCRLLVEAFVPSSLPSIFVDNHQQSSSAIFLAKKASKRKKTTTKTPSSGGGFAATTTKKNTVGSSDDYAIFPALEPDVKETLVTSPDDDNPGQQAAGELPNEIYQRLDQIYGFSQFNYESSTTDNNNNNEEEAPTMSFQDLISGTFEEDEEEENEEDDTLQISQLPPFEKLRVLHVDPLVIAVEDFFTPEECDAYVDMPLNSQKDDVFQTGSMTVGKDAKSKAQRTSTTWFNHYKNVPALMAKASRLLGLDGIDRWEEPQTVRYRRSEKFTWHLDALGPAELTSSEGGQRTATLLVYHTDLNEGEGGATIFRDMRDNDGNRLKVQPKKGSALVFFPSAGGIPNQPLDIRTLHCGESVSESSQQDKWISQLWLRATPNAYKPTAPQGNTHAAATDAISEYCSGQRSAL